MINTTESDLSAERINGNKSNPVLLTGFSWTRRKYAWVNLTYLSGKKKQWKLHLKNW